MKNMYINIIYFTPLLKVSVVLHDHVFVRYFDFICEINFI